MESVDFDEQKVTKVIKDLDDAGIDKKIGATPKWKYM